MYITENKIVVRTPCTPFGTALYNRGFSSENYKYGFNGKEKDDEVKGGGNSYDFGARIYDPRLGRWLACDPFSAKYPNLSLYNFTSNSPINAIDPDGKQIIITGTAEFKTKAFAALQQLTSKQLVLLVDGTVLEASKLPKDLPKYAISSEGTPSASNFVMKDSKIHGSQLVSNVIDNEKVVKIQSVGNSGKDGLTVTANQTEYNSDKDASNSKVGSGSTITYDPNAAGGGIVNEDGTSGRPSYIGLGHELVHAKNGLNGTVDNNQTDCLDPDTKTLDLDKEEVNTRKEDNSIRAEQRVKARATPTDLGKLPAVEVKAKKAEPNNKIKAPLKD